MKWTHELISGEFELNFCFCSCPIGSSPNPELSQEEWLDSNLWHDKSCSNYMKKMQIYPPKIVFKNDEGEVRTLVIDKCHWEVGG